MSESKAKDKTRKKSFRGGRWWRSESTKASSSNVLPLSRKWHSEESMLSKPPSSVPYYYGHITRENAELVIWDRGCLDGMYLLRACHNRDAEYVLSIGSNKQVLHYLIQKSTDGMYHLSGVSTEKFSGPVELIESNPSSLPSRLIIPCMKPVNVFMPGVNCGITEDRLREALEKKAREWGFSDEEMKAMLNNKENDMWRMIFKTLHESEGWFHGRISRSEADSRLAKSGHKNGKFLIRERDECSFSLSLSFNNQPKHYKIEVLSSGEVGIPDGPRFDNIISLVSHYSVFPDGLWCCLKYPSLNLTSSSPTSNISWPLERRGSNASSPVEAQPAFPLNRPILTPNRNNAFPTTSVNGNESEPPKPSFFAKLNIKSKNLKESEETTPPVKEVAVPQRKLFPLRPPPPPPVKGKLAAPLQSVIENVPIILPPRKNSAAVTKDQNHNDCIKNPTNNVNSHTDSVSCEENISSSVEVPKPKPLPRTRKVPLPLVLPPITSDKQTPKQILTPIPKISSPSNVKDFLNNLTPPTRFNNDANVQVGVTNGSKSPTLAVPKPVAAASSPTSLLNVIAELRNHKVMNGQNKGPILPPPESVTEVPKTDSNSGIANLRKSSNQPLPLPKSAAVHPPLQLSLSHHSSGEPNYEEIDPDYNSDQEVKETKHDSSSECLMSLGVQESKWDEVEENSPSLNTSKSFNRKPPWTKEESELHFKTIKRLRTSPIIINRNKLVVQEQLGVGNFGEVSKALFKSGNDEVPCAVKTLRPDQLSNGKDEILREARIMTKLDHPHIVRLLGVCEGEPFLLVMELAPLGPLSNYLKRNLTVSNADIMLIMYQVALGMEYLESCQFVHRDLAARNVLLVNEKFSKITDFGMSKTLGLHSDYYTVEPQGRLPLKWYAPECIYYFKFSSKSDVWSYGITLWEALSRGGKPYMGMTGREILKMFSDNTRLEPPANCPEEMYDIMKSCWEFRSEDRPTFSDLAILLKEYLKMP